MTDLEQFAATLTAEETTTLDAVRAYVEWQTERDPQFAPHADDDVALRTYLLHLRTEGADRADVKHVVASLKKFYAWARAQNRIAYTPFDEFNFDRPIIPREQIRRRAEMLKGEPHEREVARLRALNELSGELNHAAEVQTMLDVTLQKLREVMGLPTAWAFMLTRGGSSIFRSVSAPLHDFALAAAGGLPPGLDYAEQYFLRKPPDCHCQRFLREGKLTRAVNVVECSRLEDAASSSGDNQGLLFHATVPILLHGKPLGIVNVATDEWQFLTSGDLHFLTAAGAQLAVALERAHLYDLAREQREHLERELQMAHEVQASLLPRELPEIPPYSLGAYWRSAREVAGDFYDVFPLHEGKWALVIGDVSDKGAPAALYMAMARSLIRSSATRAHTPAHTLIHVNDTIMSQTSANMFVTVFYAVLDPATHTLTYANAGHNPPVLRRANGALELLTRTGRVVGAFEHLRLTDGETTLEPGDALVIYTDGVTDALNPDGADYTMERLENAIRAACAEQRASATQVLDFVREDLAAFEQDAPQPDDITLFVIAREMRHE